MAQLLECTSTLLIILAIFLVVVADPKMLVTTETESNVKVFYYILPDWGSSLSGDQICPNEKMKCNWEYSGNLTHLIDSYNTHKIQQQRSDSHAVTVAMYHIHTLWNQQKQNIPISKLKTDLNLACSEESRKHPRHSALFAISFRNFDGYSTTHPSSTIQKIYKEAYLNETILNYHTDNHMKQFDDLIKGGSFVASACHNAKFDTEAPREKIVKALRSYGFRIDGLGEMKLKK